jgi:hypothetical protein
MSNKDPSIPKVIYNNNVIKISYDPVSNNINLLSGSIFPAYVTGGWGDPHMFIRIKGTDKFLCKWGDNKSGDSGKNEILYLYMRTSRETIRIYYTNEVYTPNGAKITTNIRVVYNNTTYNIDQNFIGLFGPVRLSVRRISYGGSNYYLNYDIDWDPIPNLRQIGGALGIVLRRSLLANGTFINGGDGRFWDGYGVLGQPLGLSRSDFESGTQAQSVKAMNIVPGTLGSDLGKYLIGNPDQIPDILGATLFNIPNTPTLEGDVVDEEDNANPVANWDPTTQDAEDTFTTVGSLFNKLVTDFVEEVISPPTFTVANLAIQTALPLTFATTAYTFLDGNRYDLGTRDLQQYVPPSTPESPPLPPPSPPDGESD